MFIIPVKLYQEVTFEVEDAETFEEAREMAIEMAYDYDWSKEDLRYQAADENGDFAD